MRANSGSSVSWTKRRSRNFSSFILILLRNVLALMVSGRNKDIYEMDKVLSSGNSLTHSPENSQCLGSHIIKNLSVLGSPVDWSQRGLVLRHSFVRRLMFNRVVFGPKCPYLVMISKAPFDTKMRHCKE